MALLRANKLTSLRQVEPRVPTRGLEGLLQQIQAEHPTVRRWAARDLSNYAAAATALFQRLKVETDTTVQDAILTSLSLIGSDEVVPMFIELLQSQNAMIRNRAIEALGGMPEQVAPHIEGLLINPDPDVRIFCVNLLSELAHPHVTHWLRQVLLHEAHINVVSAALDVVAEVGGADMEQAIHQASTRFSDDPFVQFAADLAQRRVEGL